jgi:3-hydroxyacyl-CoA dehydrogenase
MKADDIHKVGILGGGVMGGGIAMTFAQAGYDTVIRDINDDAIRKTEDTILNGRFGWNKAIERGRMSADDVEQYKARLSYTTDLAALDDVDLLIEAIPEDEDLKRKVLGELDQRVKPEAIFATNTSGFPIASLNQAVGRKDRFIGAHYASPANIMKMVELVYAPETSEETFETMKAIAERTGKVPIRVKDAPDAYGFVANRVYFAAVREARKIVEEGIATPEDVDLALKTGYNWPSGPLEMFRGAQSGWQ